jgi:hypothetical protein
VAGDVTMSPPINDKESAGGDVSDLAAMKSVAEGGVISLDRDAQLQRGMKSRHIQFLALGGACVPSPLDWSRWILITMCVESGRVCLSVREPSCTWSDRSRYG